MYYRHSQINRKYKSVLTKDSDEKNGGGGSLKYSVSSYSFWKKLTALHASPQSKLPEILQMRK